jgi:AraC-like DNA-binding protein
MIRSRPPSAGSAWTPEIRVWHADGMGEVIRGPVPARMPKFVDEDLLIGVMQAGVVRARYRGADHTLQNGELILGQPGEGAAFEPVAGPDEPIRTCMRCLLSRLQDVANEIAGRTTTVPFLPQFVTPDPRLAALFLMFQKGLEQDVSRLESSSRFHDILTRIVSFHTSPPPTWVNVKREGAIVRRVREYLDAHYADSVSLEDLARIANLSAFHLNRVFRMEVGIPPHAYQTQVRVAKGKFLISQGLAIDQAATEVGFFDQSHFTNHFKRLLGFTPGVYRQSLLGTRALQDHA